MQRISKATNARVLENGRQVEKPRIRCTLTLHVTKQPPPPCLHHNVGCRQYPNLKSTFFLQEEAKRLETVWRRMQEQTQTASREFSHRRYGHRPHDHLRRNKRIGNRTPPSQLRKLDACYFAITCKSLHNDYYDCCCYDYYTTTSTTTTSTTITRRLLHYDYSQNDVNRTVNMVPTDDKAIIYEEHRKDQMQGCEAVKEISIAAQLSVSESAVCLTDAPLSDRASIYMRSMSTRSHLNSWSDTDKLRIQLLSV